MSRCVVCSNRVGKDKLTNEEIRYISAYRMPTYTSNGTLWYPKSTEAIVNVVIRKNQSPKAFDDFKDVLPGAILNVVFGVNDFTQKVYVQSYDLIPGSNLHKAEDLYLNPNKKDDVSF